MKSWTLLCVLYVACQATSPSPSTYVATLPASAWFEKLKATEGAWVADEGSSYPGATIETSVTANGSAVVEREFPGTDQEMITIYYLDGEELMLTHYCMLGNQPTLRAVPTDDPQSLHFEFVGATDLASEDDPHMHRAVFTFLGADRLRTAWTMYENGQPTETVSQEMTRRD